jgi:hypothetical protein
MWDCLALGIPLAHLWNLLPGCTPIPIDTDVSKLGNLNMTLQKRAIALFCIRVQADLRGCEPFTVTELLSDRATTDGFVKVCLTFTPLS